MNTWSLWPVDILECMISYCVTMVAGFGAHSWHVATPCGKKCIWSKHCLRFMSAVACLLAFDVKQLQSELRSLAEQLSAFHIACHLVFVGEICNKATEKMAASCSTCKYIMLCLTARIRWPVWSTASFPLVWFFFTKHKELFKTPLNIPLLTTTLLEVS